MNCQIHAAIFDMDGLLLDTEKLLVKYWRQAAKEYGFAMEREHALRIRSLAGKYAAPLLRELLGPTFDYAQVRARRKELMEKEIAQNGLTVKEGAVALLTFLRAQGIKTAVATATDEERAKRYLGSVGLLPFFDRICCATMVENGKPMPDIYLYACRELGEKPENCLALEDSPNGVLSASRAGCQVVMVPDLSEPDDETAKLLAAKVENLRAVIGLLKDGAAILWKGENGNGTA